MIKIIGQPQPKRDEIRPYKNIAVDMETQFVNYLLTEMRNSVDQAEPDGQESSFYKSMLDSEYAKIVANKDNGTGIQKLILNQILPAHLKEEYKKNIHINNPYNVPPKETK